MLGIRQLDHLVLRVSNLQAMMHFYIDVLGCTLEKVQEKYRALAVARRGGADRSGAGGWRSSGRRAGPHPDGKAATWTISVYRLSHSTARQSSRT